MSTDRIRSQSRETFGPALGSTHLDAVASLTTAHAAWLWVAAAASLFADAALTVVGVRLGLTEVNPVAVDAIARMGVLPALALLKGGAVAVAVGGWVVTPDEYRGLVPAGLALPWTLATGINLVVVGVALLA